MSIFKKVVEAHAQAKTQAEHTAASAALARTEAEDAFAKEFAKRVDEIAKPIFEKFATDAQEHGFPAEVARARDGKANPMYSIKLIPSKGAAFGANASEEVAYVLKGTVSDQKVEHASYFDQRPGRNGIKKAAFGVGSINESVLERELGEFLSAALKARVA